MIAYNEITACLKSRSEHYGEMWRFYSNKAYLSLSGFNEEIVAYLDGMIEIPDNPYIYTPLTRNGNVGIVFPNNPNIYAPASLDDLNELLDNARKYSWNDKLHCSDSREYLELFNPFEPYYIWKMAATKSKRKRIILNSVYDRLESYLSELVEYYRKEIPALPFGNWYLERRRHPEKINNAVAYYAPSDASIHFSLSSFMYGEYYLRTTIIHEMCHVKHLNHGPKFRALEHDMLRQVGLSRTIDGKEWYHKCIDCRFVYRSPKTIDYTQNPTSLPTKAKEERPFFPEIAKHKYRTSQTSNIIATQAKQLANTLNHNDYLTDKYQYVTDALWNYASNGCLRAASLLSEILKYGNEYHNIDNYHLYYLTCEKMMNLGRPGIPNIMLDCFYFGNEDNHKYDIKALNRLISDGSGLALINKADLLVNQGGDMDEAINLYIKAAEKGYSVGWRTLYCIYRFINDNEHANEALKQFNALAPVDNTNWRWIEIFAFKVSNKKRSLSILSKNPKSARTVLVRAYPAIKKVL